MCPFCEEFLFVVILLKASVKGNTFLGRKCRLMGLYEITKLFFVDNLISIHIFSLSFHQAQDPAAFGQEFANKARKVLQIRYRLLPFLYTLFYEAQVDGSTVVRPVMHE